MSTIPLVPPKKLLNGSLKSHVVVRGSLRRFTPKEHQAIRRTMAELQEKGNYSLAGLVRATGVVMESQCNIAAGEVEQYLGMMGFGQSLFGASGRSLMPVLKDSDVWVERVGKRTFLQLDRGVVTKAVRKPPFPKKKPGMLLSWAKTMAEFLAKSILPFRGMKLKRQEFSQIPLAVIDLLNSAEVAEQRRPTFEEVVHVCVETTAAMYTDATEKQLVSLAEFLVFKFERFRWNAFLTAAVVRKRKFCSLCEVSLGVHPLSHLVEMHAVEFCSFERWLLGDNDSHLGKLKSIFESVSRASGPAIYKMDNLTGIGTKVRRSKERTRCVGRPRKNPHELKYPRRGDPNPETEKKIPDHAIPEPVNAPISMSAALRGHPGRQPQKQPALKRKLAVRK